MAKWSVGLEPTFVKPVTIFLSVVTLLGVIFAQTVGSAVRTSLTIDEGLHITSGATMLRTGDFRLVEEHPPLVKMWMALPLLPLSTLPDPRSLEPWTEAAEPTAESLPLLEMTQEWLYPHRPIDQVVVPPRVMVALLTVLLGALVWRWASDLGGPLAGLLALALLALDPNILAHGALAGTDLGAACCFTLALFALARFLRRPNAPRLVLAGVTLGLAQGAKLSALLLLPVVGALVLLALPRRRILSLCLLLLLAGLTLWGLYGLQVGTVPGVPFPLPAASHAIPWMRLSQHVASGHSAFLLGENSQRGWWYYFPLAFALKTPLPTLALLGVSVLSSVCCGLRTVKRRSSSVDFASRISNLPSAIRIWGPLLLFPVLYGVSSLSSTLNIGYRHLLPILPLLLIWIGAVLARNGSSFVHFESRIANRSSVICAILLLWLAWGTIRLFPHYLAYFNELAGGPDGGWRYLADSNTDWGQGYKDLARFQQQHGLGTLRLSAFIFYDPALYGVDYEPLTPLHGNTPAIFPSRLNPPPGDYAISATTLDGIPLVDPEMFDWFRRREPDARIAHVLFYYHVAPPEHEARWLAQCSTPVAPLTAEAAAEGLGRSDLRLAYFDCSRSWLYPEGGRTAGWYAFHRTVEEENEWVRTQQAARLAYRQQLPGGLPPFSLYEWQPAADGGPLDGVRGGPIVAAPSPWPPEQAEREGQSLDAPVALAAPLAFLGYRLEADELRAGQTLSLSVYWLVQEATNQPLSLMAHLLDNSGAPVAVDDGLGVPIEIWQPGDVILQRHILQLPSDTPAGVYWLQTGAYTLPDVQRLAVLDGPPGADRLLLTQLQVGAR